MTEVGPRAPEEVPIREVPELRTFAGGYVVPVLLHLRSEGLGANRYVRQVEAAFPEMVSYVVDVLSVSDDSQLRALSCTMLSPALRIPNPQTLDTVGHLLSDQEHEVAHAAHEWVRLVLGGTLLRTDVRSELHRLVGDSRGREA